MSIKSFDNILELIKEEIKADTNAIRSTEQFNANLAYLKARVQRVDKVPGVTQR
jgi:hypothetical protein